MPSGRYRPSIDQLIKSRLVVTMWARAMKFCCEQDLQAFDMKRVQMVIEEGDALDDQVGQVAVFKSQFRVLTLILMNFSMLSLSGG